MSKKAGIKATISAALLAITTSASSVPTLGGLYDWWGGTAHFGNHYRMAQGSSASSCHSDLYVQKNIGIAANMTFTGFTYCTKSKYPKFHLMMVDELSSESELTQLIINLEKEFNIDQYRSEIRSAERAYEVHKLKELNELIEAKGSDDLTDSEIEYVELHSYALYAQKVEALMESYNIETFKQRVNQITQE